MKISEITTITFKCINAAFSSLFVHNPYNIEHSEIVVCWGVTQKWALQIQYLILIYTNKTLDRVRQTIKHECTHEALKHNCTQACVYVSTHPLPTPHTHAHTHKCCVCVCVCAFYVMLYIKASKVEHSDKVHSPISLRYSGGKKRHFISIYFSPKSHIFIMWQTASGKTT